MSIETSARPGSVESFACWMHFVAQGEMPGAMMPPIVGTGDGVYPGATMPPSFVPLTETLMLFTLMMKPYAPVGSELVLTVKSRRKTAPLGRLPLAASSATQATVDAFHPVVSV